MVAKLKFNISLEWKTEVVLILQPPQKMGVEYPYDTSLVIEWLWSSDCTDCLLPGVLHTRII